MAADHLVLWLPPGVWPIIAAYMLNTKRGFVGIQVGTEFCGKQSIEQADMKLAKCLLAMINIGLETGRRSKRHRCEERWFRALPEAGRHAGLAVIFEDDAKSWGELLAVSRLRRAKLCFATFSEPQAEP
ncbi:hypothetical protein BC567DRAFT_209795 [Phyllosticta citribraziliensis]